MTTKTADQTVRVGPIETTPGGEPYARRVLDTARRAASGELPPPDYSDLRADIKAKVDALKGAISRASDEVQRRSDESDYPWRSDVDIWAETRDLLEGIEGIEDRGDPFEDTVGFKDDVLRVANHLQANASHALQVAGTELGLKTATGKERRRLLKERREQREWARDYVEPPVHLKGGQ